MVQLLLQLQRSPALKPEIGLYQLIMVNAMEKVVVMSALIITMDTIHIDQQGTVIQEIILHHDHAQAQEVVTIVGQDTPLLCHAIIHLGVTLHDHLFTQAKGYIQDQHFQFVIEKDLWKDTLIIASML